MMKSGSWAVDRAQKIGWGVRKTHLARIDLLATEGIFVGTHTGGFVCVGCLVVDFRSFDVVARC